MKRFIKNVIAIILAIPTLILMFSLLLWSMFVKGVAIFVGDDFKPYKVLDMLHWILCSIEERIFGK